jgi:YgiT-type zinc finger domain-containing protein
MAMLILKTCPTCGSRKIKRVRRTLRRVFQGRAYVVPNVEFHVYPDCGENLFDSAATDKIQAHSPAFAKPGNRRKIRRAG